jgi:hypothetical protein
MNRIYLIILLLFFGYSNFIFAQSQTFPLRGKVVNAVNGSAIVGAKVTVQGTSVVTQSDNDGVFIIDTKLGDILIVEYTGMNTTEVVVEGIGDIIVELSVATDIGQAVIDAPVISLSAEDIEGDSQSYDISRLLQGSRDVYVSTAGFDFGQARYRIRGYNSENTSVLMNGIPVNDMETGRAFYSNWGGLNDATRLTEGYTGIGVLRNSFGDIGGATNISVRASDYSPTQRVSYSIANRNYRNRLMLTYATGLMDNGWAVTISGSRRWAQEGYVEGTFYDAWGYFLSVEKLLNKKHSLGFVFLGAPSKSGSPGVVTQEVYDLAGSNYYNPNWGFQGGEKRNARVGEYHQPLSILTHYWDFNEKTKITTSAAYSFGRGGRTALNWYDSADPRPDYYRYLPSYYVTNDNLADYYTNMWQNDEAFRQLKWDDFYNANSKNIYSVRNAFGIDGNTITGNRSKYMVEDRRIDHNRLTFTSNVESYLNENIVLSGGLNVILHKGQQFKVVSDLLGGDFWYDVDQFAERDFDDPNLSQTDLNNPNRLVYEGDRFGYDYTANVNSYDGFAQAEFFYSQFDFYLGANVSQTTFWRTGNYLNPRFPDNSFGDSEKQNFTNYGLKGGATYKITGRHYVTANATYMTRAPYFWNSYIAPRVRDNIVKGLTSETIYGGDLSYIIRSPRIKSRLTVFLTEFKDQTWSRSYYHEAYRSYINYTMTGIDKKHMGVELGLDINISPTLSGHIVAGTGDYFYSSRPLVTITRDNDLEVLADEKVAYLLNYKVGGMTHTAASAGLRYNSPKFWFVGLSGNYFDDIYLDINPDRRTAETLAGYVVEDGVWQEILDQEKLPSNYTFNIFAGKSWRIKRKYFINLNVSINNVLNNNDFSIGGFEQLRFDDRGLDKFAPKYFYLYGRSYFINLSFRI